MSRNPQQHEITPDQWAEVRVRALTLAVGIALGAVLTLALVVRA